MAANELIEELFAIPIIADGTVVAEEEEEEATLFPTTACCKFL